MPEYISGEDLLVLVLAAGEGTRMKSRRAKVLHAVAGLPMVHYPVALARELDAGESVAILGNGAEDVRKYLADTFGEQFCRIVIQEERKGTAHAVACARDAIQGFLERTSGKGGLVLVLYGDVPNLTADSALSLLRETRRQGAVVGVLSFIAQDPTGYGRIVRSSDSGDLQSIVEHRDCSDEERQIREVNSGTLCINAELLLELLDEVDDRNAKGEFYLTDVVSMAGERGLRAVCVVADSPGEVAGVNDRRELAAADSFRRSIIRKKLMMEGVTFEDPETAMVDAGVSVGMDTVIGPFTTLRGNTRIGSDVRVGVGCVLEDAVVEDGAVLEPYCVTAGGVIGRRARVGPFARLREGTVLGEDTKVGNFVETKKAVFGPGSKASHLSYIGDATLGRGVNIGAGTITCNYDGFSKHRTELGDDVFIGSDSQLVAPVRLGDRAYVAAGTTVTTDVPAGCLAISRSPQVNKEGYAEKVAKKRRTQQGVQADGGKSASHGDGEGDAELSSPLSGECKENLDTGSGETC